MLCIVQMLRVLFTSAVAVVADDVDAACVVVLCSCSCC